MRRWLVPFWLLGLLLALPAGAGSVTVEVSTAAGVRLGRLVGESQGATTYYLLADVARLASASTRRGSRGDRMSLVSRHGVVQVARDARRITVDGRRCRWPPRCACAREPGACRAIWSRGCCRRSSAPPCGYGVRRVARSPPGGEKPTVRPRSPRPRASWPCPRWRRRRRRSRPRRPRRLPGPRHPRWWRVRPAAAGRAGSAARPPARSSAAPGSARVELRVRSYPTYTRVVLEADAPIEPRLVESEGGGLTITFPDVSPRNWTGTRTVRDGLVATAELGEARGAAALRVAFERPPAARKVFRLEDPRASSSTSSARRSRPPRRRRGTPGPNPSRRS